MLLPAARRPTRLLSAAALGVVLLAVVLITAVLVQVASSNARGSDVGPCQRFRAQSLTRAAAVTGSGPRVVVVGDSYAAGLGLGDSTGSWPSRLPGRVSVSGFSGSGFSEGASPCHLVSYADRAPGAVRRGADLVVVEGGLNDVDQSSAAIRSGFERLVTELDGLRLVVVGPADAPARSRWVPRVDALLARLCAEHDVAYVATSDLSLPYLRDGLHLTPRGHQLLGDAVATRITALP